jgi:exonuclease SbcC
MRILAIRGQNLASLARSFEVDLVNGPLRNVGLFAITGPVGAGKSTLLDALCLALFDRTPRLSNRGGVPVGDGAADQKDWLRSNDPRTLLRRDAVEGWAEADFTGRDGNRYRARWAVRRARHKVDGRVQDQIMSLVDLDRDVVVAKDRKTEVLAAIELRLGLDFGQFCRSVLLAQGEFAAFLRASADERARLLENLTGADVYRKLSRAAHERRRAQEKRVETLRAQFEAQELRDPGARAALEGESARLLAEHATCVAGVDLAQQYVNWYAAAAKRQQEEAEATVELREAAAAHEAAAERRARLERLQAARGLVLHWQQLEQRRQAENVCQAVRRRAQQDVAAADERVAAARRSLQPVLQAVFTASVDVPPVVHELPRWQSLLRQRADAELRLANLREQEPRLATQERAAAAALPPAHEQLRVVGQMLQATVAQLQAAEAACNEPALADRARRRNACTVRQAQARQQAAEFDRLQEVIEAAGEAAARAADTAAARAELLRGFDELVRARDDAQRLLQAARHTLERVREVAGLAALRAQLVDGEACPLCGSHEHPLAGEPGHDVATAEQGVAAAQHRFDTAVRATAEREAQRRQVELTSTAVATQAEALANAAAAARSAWQSTVQTDAELVAVVDVTATRSLLARRLALGEEEARSLLALDERAQELTRAYHDAVRAASRANEQWHAAQTAEQAAVRQQADAAAAVRAGAAEAQRLREVLEAQQPALADAFAGVPDWARLVARLGPDLLPRLQRAHGLDHERQAAESAAAAARSEQAKADAVAERAAADVRAAAAALAQAAAAAAVTPDEVEQVAQLGTETLASEAEALAELARQVDRRRAVLQERALQRKKHEAHGRPSLGEGEAHEALELARRRRDEATQLQLEVGGQLAADDRARRQRAEIAPRLDAAAQELSVWQALDDLIGSSDGDAFVVFAQSLTLDLLLIEANRRLAELVRRYRLERNPGGEMDFVVVDLDLGGSRRGLQTLSGGETFLVSLALALALATLAAPRSRVETLFLDEGFGTLDAHNLETALGALDTLQATGCQVGVISHVEGFAERIGAVVEVRPAGGGQSRVLLRMR